MDIVARASVYILFLLLGVAAAAYSPLKNVLPPAAPLWTWIAETVPAAAPYLPSVEPANDATDVVVAPPQAAAPGRDETSGEEPASVPELWRSFEPTAIADLASEIGLTPLDTRTDTGGGWTVQVATPDGRDFHMIGKVCEDGGPCRGMQFFAILDETPPLERVNALNQDHAYLKFTIGENGEVIASKYLVADHGIARDNVAVNINTFAEVLRIVSTKTEN